MTDNIINSKNSQKMSVYCKTCVCKSCKQVAWLEQENAELKAEKVYVYTELIEDNLNLSKANAELKAENTTLKANSNAVQTYITQNQQLKTHLSGLEKKNARLKAENEKLRNELATYGATGICETCTDKANKQADKYYKTLQEIKEIVSKIIDSYIRPYGDFDQLKTILDKINEVIGAE